MFMRKYGDIIVSLFFMALSAAMMVMAKRLPKSAVMEIGPDFMPMCVGVLTFALAAVLMALSVKNLKGPGSDMGEAEQCDYKRVLVSFLLILAYVYVLQPVGFIVSTIVYLPIQMSVLAPADKRGKKDAAQLLIVSLVFTFAVFFLFRYGFKIVLPAGIFTINL